MCLTLALYLNFDLTSGLWRWSWKQTLLDLSVLLPSVTLNDLHSLLSTFNLTLSIGLLRIHGWTWLAHRLWAPSSITATWLPQRPKGMGCVRSWIMFSKTHGFKEVFLLIKKIILFFHYSNRKLTTQGDWWHSLTSWFTMEELHPERDPSSRIM